MTNDIPRTRYVTLGDDRIAYQVFGEGEVDLLLVEGIGDGIDTRWYWPPYANILRRLATQARIITFDLRGTGASDPPSGEILPGWELWADEARAVLDTVSSERAVLLGCRDGGPAVTLFAASHPTRTRGLILVNTTACYGDASEEFTRSIQEGWATDALARYGTPDAARDPAYLRWVTMSMRQAASPGVASTLLRLRRSTDVRQALASVRIPTLVLHREGFKGVRVSDGRYLADHIPGARLALVPGSDGTMFTEPSAEILGHIEDFLSNLHGKVETDRALAAILFTDIVGSTERAAALGDREWRNLLETHDAVARTVVEQHRGRLIKLTGDGLLATFDGPGRAIRCATALGDAVQPLGLQIRAGLHTGEVEVRETDIAGIGVHIAARVLDVASPGDLLVSAAVPMLVAGSGFEFEDRGEHELKGVPGSWKLFAVKG